MKLIFDLRLKDLFQEYIGRTFIGYNHNDLTAYFDSMEACVANLGPGNTSPASLNGVPTTLIPKARSFGRHFRFIHHTVDQIRRHNMPSFRDLDRAQLKQLFISSIITAVIFFFIGRYSTCLARLVVSQYIFTT